VSIGRTVTAKAQGKVMTLGELRAFVAELDQAGAAETTPIKAHLNWGSGLKSLEAAAVRFGDPGAGRQVSHGTQA
jgi:hypothetical protein